MAGRAEVIGNFAPADARSRRSADTYAGVRGSNRRSGLRCPDPSDAAAALIEHTRKLSACNSVDFLLDDDRPAFLDDQPAPLGDDGLVRRGLASTGCSMSTLERPVACAARLARGASQGGAGHGIVYALAPAAHASTIGCPAWSRIPRPGSDLSI